MKLPDGKVIPPTGKAFDVEFAPNRQVGRRMLIEIAAFRDSALRAKQIGVR